MLGCAREGGRAEWPTLACPLAPLSRTFPFAPRLEGLLVSFIPSRSEIFRGDAAKLLFSPAEGERFLLAATAIFGSLVLVQAGLARRKFDAKCLPCWRNM